MKSTHLKKTRRCRAYHFVPPGAKAAHSRQIRRFGAPRHSRRAAAGGADGELRRVRPKWTDR